MREQLMQKCRKCGKRIAIITWGVYRKAVVDPEAVMVKTDERGEQFLRIDGSKIKGIEVPYESGERAEPAYRTHRCGGRK